MIIDDGQCPFQPYDSFSGFESEEAHIMSNSVTATEAFNEEHPEETTAFLELWQRGIGAWFENQEDIISTYPQHFAVEEQEDIAFMQEFISGESDWFMESVYFTVTPMSSRRVSNNPASRSSKPRDAKSR